jgi:hypothetical protein
LKTIFRKQVQVFFDQIGEFGSLVFGDGVLIALVKPLIEPVGLVAESGSQTEGLYKKFEKTDRVLNVIVEPLRELL